MIERDDEPSENAGEFAVRLIELASILEYMIDRERDMNGEHDALERAASHAFHCSDALSDYRNSRFAS